MASNLISADLREASALGSVADVRTHLNNGEPVDKPDKHGVTALYAACQQALLSNA